MALSTYREQMNRCGRCSSCKFVVSPQMKSHRFSEGCPSIQYGNFHAYSAGGKVITALGLLEGMIDCTEDTLKSIFACSMCGNCDVSCKLVMGDMVEPMEIIKELRIKLVEDGEMDLSHSSLMENLKREDNIFGEPKGGRSSWAEGLKLKDALEEKADVFLHIGCCYSYKPELWPIIRGAVTILQHAGIDVGIAKKEESCCGGRAFEMGFRGVAQNYAESLAGRVKESGAKMLITCCADGYGTFKQLYPNMGIDLGNVEIMHITEAIAKFIKDGELLLTERVPLRVTYHDPCHLGRLGEAKKPWNGKYKTLPSQLVITEPEKEVNFGMNGVFDPPREILRAIPGLEFVEMERIREYAYCCGAGGGAKEAYPDFALMAAQERVEEAKTCNVDAMVTACPWCVMNFKDAITGKKEKIEVYDIIELVLKGLGRKE